MYYNNSNRLLTEAYQENMSELNEKLEQELFEAISEKIYDSIKPLIKLAKERHSELVRYRADIRNHPDNHRYYLDSYKAEIEKVGKAINIAQDLVEDLKDLEKLIKTLQLKPPAIKGVDDNDDVKQIYAKNEFDILDDIFGKLEDIMIDWNEEDNKKDGGLLGKLVKKVKDFDLFKRKERKGTLQDVKDNIKDLKVNF